MENKLTINLVTWNGEKYIPALFESLSKQSYKNWELVVIDNCSTDNTVSLIEDKAKTLGVPFKVIKNSNNLGFAVAHNLALAEVKTDYFVIINQDIFLEFDALEKMVKFMEARLNAVAVGPRVMKWDFVNNEKTEIVDTLGLQINKKRQITDIGEGEIYQPAKLEFKRVFGLSGVITMFRTNVIKNLDYFFDESLGSYKEDVDLAYELNLAGAESYILYDAVAYHDRTGKGVKTKNDFNSALNKNKQSTLVKYNSYRNHLIVLYKNEFWQNFILDFIWIFWYEFKKFIFFLVFDRKILLGWLDFYKQRKILKNKRQENIKQRKITWREFRYWLN